MNGKTARGLRKTAVINTVGMSAYKTRRFYTYLKNVYNSMKRR